MIELAVLGLLKDQDLHGYQLKKQLAEALGALSSVSFGSLYPALARLQAAGAVETVAPVDDEPTRPVIPMTGSLTGEAAAYRTSSPAASSRRGAGPRSARGRKVYRITPQGERLFEELLAAGSASADDDRAFNLRLAFCRHLPPEVRLGLFERRRAHLVERLARARGSVRSRPGRMDAYTRSLIEHGTEMTERDISWLDTLIATERQRGLSTT